MTVEYQKVWTTMNDLEMVTSKICSAREIIDNAVEKIQGQEYDKAELLMNAAYEFLEYYLQEFDDKFKLAWQATVGDLRNGDKVEQKSWNSFWESYYPEESEQYTEEELNAMCDKAEADQKNKKWILPVEEVVDNDTYETNYTITFPEDLLEKANLTEGDEIEWIDNKDGSYSIRKVIKNV